MEEFQDFQELSFSKDSEMLNLTHPIFKRALTCSYYIALMRKIGKKLYCTKNNNFLLDTL